MYSIVLMMALSGGTTLPAGHHCCGCCNCYSSCCGCNCSSSCSCHGHHHSCCGCCNGYSSCNCSCHGHHHKCCGCCNGYSCCGCYSCCGGYSYGCCGCCGGWSCGGCCGGYGVGAPVIEGAPAGAPAGAPRDLPPGKKPEELKKPPKATPEAANPTSATIIVSLPAEAKLFVDGHATASTSSTRVLASPGLETGKDYNYTLKAEIVRDGKTVTALKQVTVRAGEESRVSFDFAEVTLAAN